MKTLTTLHTELELLETAQDALIDIKENSLLPDSITISVLKDIEYRIKSKYNEIDSTAELQN